MYPVYNREGAICQYGIVSILTSAQRREKFCGLSYTDDLRTHRDAQKGCLGRLRYSIYIELIVQVQSH